MNYYQMEKKYLLDGEEGSAYKLQAFCLIQE